MGPSDSNAANTTSTHAVEPYATIDAGARCSTVPAADPSAPSGLMPTQHPAAKGSPQGAQACRRLWVEWWGGMADGAGSTMQQQGPTARESTATTRATACCRSQPGVGGRGGVHTSVARGLGSTAQRAGPYRRSIAACRLWSQSSERTRGDKQLPVASGSFVGCRWRQQARCRWRQQARSSGAGCGDRCAECSVALLTACYRQLEIFRNISQASELKEEHPMVPIKTVVAV